ncbi:hypothetical protein [Pontimicrobium aquaticum]|uniref:Por secretion system C-terminal sorting domain-containing protein n=1 Tax=Pontimicrobium aquaticum TaxID=2565367 RepID=A0A4U0EMV8_9FLAO|nr:hypothetical protein [Pontimicrobium aquaticum]TJY32923.1 hypothetical protein E5167_13900 [Pontimicrobium aquaticum]
MNFKKYLLLVGISLLSTVGVFAQEGGLISSIDDFSIDKIEYNPNGIRILAFDNTLEMEFKNEVSNLRYEVINNKGDLLLSKEEATSKKTLLNISKLKEGTYYIRVFSDQVKDFLKFKKT